MLIILIFLFWCNFFRLNFLSFLFGRSMLYRVSIHHRFILHFNIIAFLLVELWPVLAQVKTFISYKVKTPIRFFLLIFYLNGLNFSGNLLWLWLWFLDNLWLDLLFWLSHSFWCSFLGFWLDNVDTWPSCTFPFCANYLCFGCFLCLIAFFGWFRSLRGLVLIAFSRLLMGWRLLRFFDSLFLRSFCIPLFWLLFLCLLIFLFIWLLRDFFWFTWDRYFFFNWLLRLSFGCTVVTREWVVFEVWNLRLHSTKECQGNKANLQDWCQNIADGTTTHNDRNQSSQLFLAACKCNIAQCLL